MLLNESETGGRPVAEALLHPTGEISAQLMIVAMMITPLRMLFPRSRFVAGMLRYRRGVGVAAFCYALAHTVLYIIDMGTLRSIFDEFLSFGIWTGWLAVFLLVPLAITSNNWSVRRLGRNWKTLQRVIYLEQQPR
jgi:sulfoxide reductase heme-binding subunit YedZ